MKLCSKELSFYYQIVGLGYFIKTVFFLLGFSHMNSMNDHEKYLDDDLTTI